MDNPWLDLPETEPFVLECDRQNVESFNLTAKENHHIHTEVWAEPYTGNPEAEIVLLNLNPGYYKGQMDFLPGNPNFLPANRANLRHEKREYPFYLLDPRLEDSPGYWWWTRKLRPLIDLFPRESDGHLSFEGLRRVANEVFVVEFFPYHTRNYSDKMCVPSQKYSLYLVREALKRNALIIQMRSQKIWQQAIPELGKPSDDNNSRYFILNNPQNPTISPNNCPDGFPEIRKIFERKYGPLAQSSSGSAGFSIGWVQGCGMLKG